MIRFEDHTLESIGEKQYLDYFLEAFGYLPSNHLPGFIVIMYEDDETIGFASWYRQNLNTMYLQYIGFIDNTKRKYTYFTKMIDYLLGKGLSIVGSISNNNKAALIWAMRYDFKVIGVEMLPDNPLLIEVLKVKEGV